MAATKIEWTDATWNPVTGCSKISPGCANCYAERMAKRLKAMGQAHYKDGFEVRCHPDALDAPLSWRRPQNVFVNSMSDLLHEEVPMRFVDAVFDTMVKAHWHRFQVLTKRSERLAEVARSLEWPDNVWMGVSIENQDYVWRADDLRSVPAAVRFLSIEPLIAPITDLDLTGIDWVIVGGESGPGARAMKLAWVVTLRDLCSSRGVPFFFKQWGGVNKKQAGRLLEGRTWDEMPMSAVAG